MVGTQGRDNEGEIWLECSFTIRLVESLLGKKSGQLNEDMGVDGAGQGGWRGWGLTVRGGGDIVPSFSAKSCPAVNLTKGSREEDAGLASKKGPHTIPNHTTAS